MRTMFAKLQRNAADDMLAFGAGSPGTGRPGAGSEFAPGRYRDEARWERTLQDDGAPPFIDELSRDK